MNTPLSPRLVRLRDQIMSRKGSFPENTNPFEMDLALWRAAHPERSRVQIRAAYLHELVKLAQIEIFPDWQLAGEHLPTAKLSNQFGFVRSTTDAPLHALQAFDLTPREIQQIEKTVREWTVPANFSTIGETSPESRKGLGSWGEPTSTMVYWASGWIENHSIRDYAKVLRQGFAGIRNEIVHRLAETRQTAPDFPRQENFWRAALHICDAGIALGQRYAQLAAEKAAAATEPAEKVRLLQMRETCAQVPARGARTFFEAVQSLWLTHILTCGEDGINANSIGRLDQILWPHYEADIAAGCLTRETAREILAELACKLYLEYDVQAIVLGGVTADGKDAVNDLSCLILEATRQVEFVRDLSVRLHPKSPKKFVHACAELIVRGGGIPFVFNDDCFIPALNERGISLEDARDYAPIGCIELTIPGKANPHAVSGWMNSTKCLELALFGGREPETDQQLGPVTPPLTEIGSFEEFYRYYCRQLAYFSEQMVYYINRGELAQRERGPLPCWSVLTDACIERGRDITDGGARYNYHSICFLGTANTADSLIALKKLVFEEKKLRRLSSSLP